MAIASELLSVGHTSPRPASGAVYSRGQMKSRRSTPACEPGAPGERRREDRRRSNHEIKKTDFASRHRRLPLPGGFEAVFPVHSLIMINGEGWRWLRR